MANTLKFGNGEWYGKKDTILAYNDENSNYKPLLFDFSRASKATRVNKDGLIEEVGSGQPRVDYLNNTKGALKLEPSRTNLITYSEDFPRTYWTKSGATIQGNSSTAGSELVTNGDFATDSDWNKGTGWTISGGKASSDGSQTSGSYLSQGLSGVSQNKQYITEFDIVVTSGSFRFNTLGGNLIVTESGNYTITSTSTSGTSLFLEAFSDFVGSIDNVSVKEVQGFTSLDGTNNAYKLVEGTNNGGHTAYKLNASISSGVNYTYSVFVKGTERVLQMVLSSGFTSNFCNFDLSDGTIGSNNGLVDSNITSFSNGWYRCDITALSNGTSGHLELILAESKTSSRYTTYQGNGTSSIYIYGAQLEAGSYATSYIATSGSSVTRLAESCSQTVPDGVIGQTEGTIFAEFKIPETETPSFFSISNGNINNRIIFGYYNGNLAYYVNSSTGSFFTTGIIDSSPIIGQTYKIAVAYKSNDFKIYKNGINTNTETTFTVPSSLTVIDNQGGMGVGQYIFAKVKQFSLYNTRLTNSELAALTQV